MLCLMLSKWPLLMSESLKISSRGQGPELVLLHGWAMHSGIWSGIVDVLASEFRVNLVDLPGHGMNRDVPLSRQLNDLVDLLLSRLPPAVWMGWSLGGLVTLAAAIKQPHKVQKAILVAATPCFSFQEDWECGVDIASQQAFIDGLENDFEGTLKQFYLQCFGANWLKHSLRLLGQAPVGNTMPANHVMHTGLHLLYSNKLLGGLGNCGVPTIFLGGTRDRIIKPESFEKAAALMPDASCCLIRGAGHAPFISHQDRFLDIIRGFILGEQSA